MTIGLRIPVMALILLWGTLAVPAVEADEVTIETITERLKQWRSQFANLRMVFEQSDPELLRRLQPNVDPDGFFHRMEFVWTDYGPGRQDLSNFKDGVMISRESHFTNGKLVFDVEYSEGAENVVHTKSANINTPRFKPQTTLRGVMPLTCLWFGSDQWLHELFDKFKAVVLREESREGARCVLVQIQRYDSPEVLWLDLDRNFLPRRIDGPSKDGKSSQFEVQEFREVQPGVWFPVRGRLQTISATTWRQWKVTELEINAHLPNSLFELPTLSPGTWVEDLAGNQRYRVGETHKTTSMPRDSSSPLPSSLPINASPRVNGASIYFAISAVVLALLGLWLVLRQRG